MDISVISVQAEIRSYSVLIIGSTEQQGHETNGDWGLLKVHDRNNRFDPVTKNESGRSNGNSDPSQLALVYG